MSRPARLRVQTTIEASTTGAILRGSRQRPGAPSRTGDGCQAYDLTTIPGSHVGPPLVSSVTTMCVDRRTFLAGGAALAAVAAAGATGGPGASVAAAGAAQQPPAPVEVAPGLSVLRRESWGAGLPAPSGLPTEAPGDVRVLLVHHSASTNDYGEDQAADQIRQFHALHTGPDKGWPDVAYNFFVDRYGRVWEGRAGSVDGPVIGDATGGNQGFSQLVCLIGNFEANEPTPEAMDTLAGVLAWLAGRDGVDVTPGATTSFTSRGSNRWPAGTTVETTTIAGHRDMSQTACPGDAAYARVRGDLPGLVAQRAAATAPAPATTAPTTTVAPTTADPSTTATAPAAARRGGVAAAAPARATRSDGGPPAAVVGGAAVTAAAAAAALAVRLRGRRPPSEAG
jgi:N-acetylmuramoyl-L-alanine amidase